MEEVLVSGISLDESQAKVTIRGVPDRPGVAARIFKRISQMGWNGDMIIQNVSQGSLADISFTVPRTDLPRALPMMEKAKTELGAQTIEVKDEIAKVSIVGVGMRSHSGVASRMFQALSREGINILMISTSEIKISCVLDERDLDSAINALHQEFALDVDEPPETSKQ